MKKIISYIILFIITTFSFVSLSFADPLDAKWDARAWTDRSSYADSAKWWFGSNFFWWTQSWEKWIEWLLFTAARNLKDVLIAVAVIYLFILVLRIIYGQGSEEDLKKMRLGILWTTFGIVLMQVAYVAVTTLYNKDIWAATAQDLTTALLMPFIRLLEVVTSFLFISMAFMAFYRIVTSWWWEDWFKKWLKTVMNAVIGFMLVKISAALVYSVYGKNECNQTLLGTQQCSDSYLGNPNISDTVKIIASTIKYLIWFLWITTVILIIFAWFTIITSSWDEAKVKKWKSTIKYIIIWMLLIVCSVILFNFITWKELSNVVWSYR